MAYRSNQNVTRSNQITIVVDGAEVLAYVGETIAATLISSDTLAFRRDQAGRSRGPMCNMGVCYECLVQVDNGAKEHPTMGPAPWVLACMTPIEPGMKITTTNYTT